LSELLLRRFQAIKETFDDRESANIQLPNEYRDDKNKIHSIEAAEGYTDKIIDGVVNLSR